MNTLYPIRTFSLQRKAWILLLFCIIFFESCALFFQHVMNLAPCVMCIYERIAMLSIGIAAIIGAIAPQNGFFRWVGLAGWGIGAIKGLTLALQHVEFQLHPSPFHTCDIFVTLPNWMPLNKWMPWMFKAYGDCSDIVWQFLSLSMPQWLVVVFAANLVALAIVIIAQFSRKPNTLR
ncbi:disulfide bond formation protein DsbB [Vibrio nitrifigilis]|uniref:Disulfide bond formation protein B n=1 Tax=Vibrio nitrifigilis TaxID=2789781 RepID=A0ABS0GC34_9VIBR|nr:disulfide bond formation protein DsbB [Vibrio nitrifigilis]MBF8999969.1 disulfide bond formation protein DsbB [Vibrio nitrifigilis]